MQTERAPLTDGSQQLLSSSSPGAAHTIPTISVCFYVVTGWNLLAGCQNTDQSHLLLLLPLPERSASQRILTFPLFVFSPCRASAERRRFPQVQGVFDSGGLLIHVTQCQHRRYHLFNMTHYISILRSIHQTLFLTVCMQVGGVSNRKN